MTLAHASQRGVSLVEAMVAMVIMAFGMLGLVGLQASMRLNADVAKQRAEATRLAQERLEQWRSYDTVATYTTTVVDAAASTAAGPSATNTSYTIAADVSPDTLPVNAPPLRQGSVTVAWMDRASQPQSVTLLTQVAGVSPVLAGSLSAQGQGSPTRRMAGRNSAIPKGAVNQPGGQTSRFTPPNSSNVVWEFNNLTGLITRICDPLFVNCSTGPFALLSGNVLFDYSTFTPTSEGPFADAALAVGVRGALTVPANTNVDCYTSLSAFYVVYYCAVPMDTSRVPAAWTGYFELHGGPLNVPSDASDGSADKQRVCRYTPENTDTPASGNAAHPRVYTLATTSLTNQNYLVIRNGNGASPTACPGDGPSTFVNTNTYLHQPAP